MLPTETHVGRVSLQVADLERSRRFYEDVLGMRPVAEWLEDGHRMMRLGAVESGDTWLLELYEKRGVRAVPRRGLIGLYHFAVLLPARADLGRFIVHASNVGVPMGAADHLVSEALYLTDPDGLQVEMYVDRPPETWARRAGEIAMATDPLDFDPIIASAGATTWSGLPPGTVIGHVHHYVESIDAARAFYVSAFGFDPVVESFPGALFVSAGGYHHHVGLNIWAAGAPRASEDDARLLYWEVVLPSRADADAAAARLTRAGYRVEPSRDHIDALDPFDIRMRIVWGATHAPQQP